MGMGESDTRAKLIDPAIHNRGWTEDLIRREETAGAIEIIKGKARRRAKGRVDYTLRIKVSPNSQPVAVALIEAKAEDLSPAHGLEQAKAYADCKRLNVPFVFSCNGHLFVEYDRFSGFTSDPIPMVEFPTPEELRARYELHMGFNLSDAGARPLLVPYSGGEATRRYYQDAAIRATLEKIARCERTGEPKRALLSLATGAGKTFIAVHLLKRIADAELLKRALFLCDRDELRTQGLGAFQAIFGTDVAEVFRKPDGTNNARNARIHVATYQTLDIDNEDATAKFLTTCYPENYFSHIIIDECHRSAWGKWSQVLKLNPDAVQIGLTATPRKLEVGEKSMAALEDLKINADNLQYFGEPVYEYDMSQGIEDGYLAACEIVKGRVSLDENGLTIEEIMAHNPRDANTGRPLTREDIREIYERRQFEDIIQLPDRVLAMCQDLFRYFLATGGPEQKTIIFCVRDRHADQVAITMNNLYAQWCAENGRERLEHYAFKCTASVCGGNYVSDLKGSSRSHFVAATVDLLSTGVDVPAVRNIVFFKYVRSPISFYQMVGRGTRLDYPTGKLMFRVYDYTNATRLFGEEFRSKVSSPVEPREPGPEEDPEPIIVVEGLEVHVSETGHFIVTQVDGKAMPVTVEEYKERLAAKLVEEAPTLEAFRKLWVAPTQRSELLESLPDGGRSALLVQQVEQMTDYDLYDVLADLGYGLSPKTREERAQSFGYKQKSWLEEMPGQTRATVEALAAQFALSGTDGLENPQIFQVPEVARAGGLKALKEVGKPFDVLRETKERMFATA
jgi:type I restriction enzyme R subunit